MVTGGSFDDNLSSTEVLVEGGSEWIFSDPLPSPRNNIHGASLNNRIVVAGDVHIAQHIKCCVERWTIFLFYSGGYYPGMAGFEDILEFDGQTEQWRQIGTLKKGRYLHSTSVIDYNMIKEYCN